MRDEDRGAGLQRHVQRLPAAVEKALEVEQHRLPGRRQDADLLHRRIARDAAGAQQRVHYRHARLERIGAGGRDLPEYPHRAALPGVAVRFQGAGVELDLHVADLRAGGDEDFVERTQRRQDAGVAGVEILLVVEHDDLRLAVGTDAADLHVVELAAGRYPARGVDGDLGAAAGGNFDLPRLLDEAEHGQRQPVLLEREVEVVEVAEADGQCRAHLLPRLRQGQAGDGHRSGLRQVDAAVAIDLERIGKRLLARQRELQHVADIQTDFAARLRVRVPLGGGRQNGCQQHQQGDQQAEELSHLGAHRQGGGGRDHLVQHLVDAGVEFGHCDSAVVEQLAGKFALRPRGGDVEQRELPAVLPGAGSRCAQRFQPPQRAIQPIGQRRRGREGSDGFGPAGFHHSALTRFRPMLAGGAEKDRQEGQPRRRPAGSGWAIRPRVMAGPVVATRGLRCVIRQSP